MDYILLILCAIIIVGLLGVVLFSHKKEPYIIKSKKLIKVLKFGTETLEQNNIPYWLYHGTLLGIIRDKAIIEGDNDTDCCIPKSYTNRLMGLKKYCNDKGYKLYRDKGKITFKHNIPLGQDFCRIVDKSTGYHLDIGLAVETHGFLSDPCTDIQQTLRQTWKQDTIFPLKTIEVFGSKFTIPNKYNLVNFTQYNSDCYNVKKTAKESLKSETKHNEYTENLLLEIKSL